MEPGEVIGLVGENGAGKSTLMKVLGGVVAPTRGRIRIDGAEREAMTVAGAIGAGIAFVHQELNLLDNLDAAGNVFIGREPRTGPLRLIDRRRMAAEVGPIFARLGVDFAPDAPVAELSLAQRQLLEIAKALSLKSRLVIMDEPTSSLTISETERLLKVIADLKATGVSDHLHLAPARRGEGLRRPGGGAARRPAGRPARARGDHAGGDDPADDRPRPQGDLQAAGGAAGRAAARDRGRRDRRAPGQAGRPRGAARRDPRARRADRRRAHRARPGGVRHRAAGRPGAVRLDGRAVAVGSPRTAIGEGIYLVPEDRKACGVVLDFSVARERVAAAAARRWRRSGWSTARPRTALAEAGRRRLGIRAPDVETMVGTLSGGNQQKVVLAKWLAMQPRAIIFDEPTRGIDVGAKREIYDILRGLADAGVAVLMISSDMEEVIGVSDRIAVMHDGRIAGTLERAEFSEPACSSWRSAAGTERCRRRTSGSWC